MSQQSEPLGEGFFLDMLHSGFTEEKARQQLDPAINWGRYGAMPWALERTARRAVLG